MRLGIRLRSPRAAISLMFALNGIVWGTWIARIPGVANHLDVSKSQLGSVLPAFAIGALIALPAAGWLVGKIGSARSFTIFGLLRTAFFPLLAFAPTPVLLAFVLFLFGLAHGVVDVSANSQGVEIERKTLTSMLSSVHGFCSLGGLIGAMTAGVIAETGLSLQLHFTLIAIPAFMLYAIASRGLVRDEVRPASFAVRAARKRRLQLSLPPRILWPLGFIALCVAIGDESIADWGGLYLKDELQTTAAVAALSYTVYSLTMLIGRLSGDLLVRKLGPVRVIAVGGAMSAIGLITGLLIGTAWSALIGFGLVGLGLSVILPITYRAAGSTPGISRGKAVASVATVGYLGFLAGPPIIGTVADAASLRGALLLVGLVTIALIPLSRSTARPDPRDDLLAEDDPYERTQLPAHQTI
ncbi:MAG: MFS transporter [Thermomicrobiales bacterium]